MIMVTESGIPSPTGPDVVGGTRESAESELLAPYLPRLVIDWIASVPGERHRIVDGTVAFVDISGFTKLSEGLAKHGKVGAEELTATIGPSFVPSSAWPTRGGSTPEVRWRRAAALFLRGGAPSQGLPGRLRDAPCLVEVAAHRARPT